MSPSDQLIEAIRAIVRDELEKPARKEVKEKLAWVSLLFLVILAVDISAVIWELADFFDHPVFKLVVSSAPAVVGVSLAAYKERLQEVVRGVANNPWFRTAVTLGLIVIVLPIINTYNVPLKLSDQKLEILIDGKQVNAGPLKNGVVRIPVSGLHEHELSVVGYGAEDHTRKDSYRLRLSDLVKTILSSDTTGFEIGLLVPVTVGVGDSTIRSVLIVGKFPELFLRGAPDPFETVTSLPNGRYEISVKARGGADSQELALPPGDYLIRYAGFQCDSKAESLHLTAGSAGDVSLEECGK